MTKSFDHKPQLVKSELLRVKWEGSQFVYHSLAHVNRQICLGLLDSQQVELSLVPYEVDQFNGKDSVDFDSLAKCTMAPLSAPTQVHVRHHWPPNFNAPAQGAWVIMQPWEYGGIPREWLRPMRDEVDEIWVYSTWVRDCYLASGIPEEKVKIIPLGVDATLFQPEGAIYPLRTKRTFRFLFLGGTIHRKGIDVLLEAYRKAFRATDDVCLVIKGQSGLTYQGSELHHYLSRIAQEDPGAPEIEYLTPALQEPQLASLYRACDAFVMPYRGEGFGLPMAEAMACELPVIATGRGAAMDFLNEDRAYLIPSVRQPISSVPVGSFRPSGPGFWLEEPDESAVIDLLRRVYLNPDEAIVKGRKARAYVVEHLSWEIASDQALKRIRILASRTPVRFMAKPSKLFREAFLVKPEWGSDTWVEILTAFVKCFRPGEPVALVFFVDVKEIDPTDAQEAIVSVLTSLGNQEFADIVIIDNPIEVVVALHEYDSLHWTPTEVTDPVTILGAQAKRFFDFRRTLAQATQ